MKQYRVFGRTLNGVTTGGKRVAVAESPDSNQMSEVAQASESSLTAFIVSSDTNTADVRYFNRSGQEKPDSDSGALVVAHHLASGQLETGFVVTTGGGSLTVKLEDGAYWSAQGDHHVLPSPLTDETWLADLNVSNAQRDPELSLFGAGTVDKYNLIVPVRDDALNRLKPDFDALSAHLLETGINGAILAAFGTNRAQVNFRFFAPHKGLREDNAGSFTLASLCGYLASLASNGVYNLTGAQGYAMGKPSSLRAKFIARDGVALAVGVGGTVEEVV